MILRIFILSLCLANTAQAWTRRGHELSAYIAAKLISEKEDKGFIGNHSFDLGYYGNIPDILFRAEHNDEFESVQHYLDWDSKVKEHFKSPRDLPVDFVAFKSAMGADYDRKVGLSPWRIKQIHDQCKDIAKDMIHGPNREKQGPLLVCLGILSHYISDLAVPLHTTVNYNGEKTGQKGIHEYFETVMVNELDPDIRVEALKFARKQWPKFENRKLDPNQYVRWLIEDSMGDVEDLLLLDKKAGRKDKRRAARRFEDLIIKRLSTGAIVTALAWKDILKGVNGWDSNRFYFFDYRPEYIKPVYEDVEK